MDTNWKGQKRHEVDNYCWFMTNDKDREMMKQLYDRMVGKDKSKEAVLIKLIEMARAEARCECHFDLMAGSDT